MIPLSLGAVLDADHFLETLSMEILDPSEYAGGSMIAERLASFSSAMRDFESLTGVADYEDFLARSDGLALANLLMGLPRRRTGAIDPATLAGPLSAWRDWLAGESLRGVVAGLLLAEANGTRARRRLQRFEEQIEHCFESALARLGSEFTLQRTLTLPVGGPTASYGRTFDFVIAKDAQPIVAVTTIFQTAEGGRQQYIVQGLPELQARLLAAKVLLLVVADGPGFRGIVDSIRKVTHFPP